MPFKVHQCEPMPNTRVRLQPLKDCVACGRRDISDHGLKVHHTHKSAPVTLIVATICTMSSYTSVTLPITNAYNLPLLIVPLQNWLTSVKAKVDTTFEKLLENQKRHLENFQITRSG